MKSDLIVNQARTVLDEVIAWRRELHRIPELGFELFKTSAFIKKQLNCLNIPCQVMAETGLVALVEGGEPGPTLAFRADMDALPIKEETGLPYASDNGNMHACGHDAHAAMLLGASKILSANRDKIKGRVKLIFQPGEEGYGGAQKMIEEGCLKNPDVDAIYGLHVGQIFPEVGLGQVGVCSGTILAAATAFTVEVIGKSTHGALPHLGVDSITTAAEMITSLQKIISREINPLETAVLTIGKIEGGEAINIVTPRVEFSGDFRTIDQENRHYITGRVKEICASVAAANRAKAEVKIIGGYPPTVNHPAFAEKVTAVAEQVVGSNNVVSILKPNMGTEDMSLYLEKVPGAFFMLGTGNPERGFIYPHHNSRFDLDESALWIGPAIFTTLALDYLN